MQNLSPSYFFDLSSYAHAALFNHCTLVWEALKNIESYLKKTSFKIEIDIPTKAFLIDKETISIGKGTVVEPGAYIKGPCIIGENCQVRQGAYIRGNFICGNDCVIGHDSEIKNSIFLNGTHAAHFAYVGDSILGNHVNLGAGTICANLKLDRSNVFIHFEDKRVDTGLKKFGAVLGDSVQTGCNSVTNPGTLMGKSSFCYPCMNFGGVIPSHSLVKKLEKILVLPLSSKAKLK